MICVVCKQEILEGEKRFHFKQPGLKGPCHTQRDCLTMLSIAKEKQINRGLGLVVIAVKQAFIGYGKSIKCSRKGDR
ncbi:MAG: hypothetical protein Q8P32_00455 [Candidatus Komeilibacteria bacterium]|nr:hypothetical protein [Candidatus Komeilibacteria bacterium]